MVGACVQVRVLLFNMRYARWFRSGVGHNRFHMLGKDKEKKEGAESFNTMDSMVSEYIQNSAVPHSTPAKQ